MLAPPPVYPEPTKQCEHDEQPCAHEAVCLKVWQFCDGRPDCPGGEDEEDCPQISGK